MGADVDARQLRVLSALDKYIEGLEELTPEALIPLSVEWYQFLNKWGVTPKVFVMTPTKSPLIDGLSLRSTERGGMPVSGNG